MANIHEKYSDNVPGPWYVDKNCICCGLCAEYAPAVFRLSDSGDHNIAFHQPATEDELNQAIEAMEGCPADAIGRNE